MENTPPDIPLIPGLSSIAGRYPAMLCDVWGVLHNGKRPYDGVCEALSAYRRQGGIVLFLSNAPRPHGPVVEMFKAMGVPDECYDGILTSGDATRLAMSEGSLGRRFFHVGPDRDAPLFDGLPIEKAALEEADFCLMTGLWDDETETPDDYADLIAKMKARNLPVICANPDIIVDRGDKQIYCAGAVAEKYRAAGGKVIYFGKPHAPIYKAARAELARLAGREVADKDIIAIGDGIHTDVEGANRAGMDVIFVTGGIAAARFGDPLAPDMGKVAAFMKDEGVTAIGAMPRLIW